MCINNENYNKNENVTRRVFTIPVGGLSKDESIEKLKTLMSEYNQKIELDESSGDVKYINMTHMEHIPNNNEIWIPVTNNTKENPIKRFIKRIFNKND